MFRTDELSKAYTALVLCMLFVIPIAHLTFGRRGLISMVQLRGQIAQAGSKLDLIRAQRISLENQVRLLSAHSLDLDMLDEKARKILDVAAPNEVVVLPRR